MSHTWIGVDGKSVRGQYLGLSARVRGLSRRALLQRVIDKLLDDHLILAVMDDADECDKVTKIREKQIARQNGRIEIAKQLWAASKPI